MVYIAVVKTVIKFIFFSVIIIISLVGYGGPSLGEQIDISLSIEPQTVVLNEANFLQQKGVISYSIANNSTTDLVRENYEIILGMGLTGAMPTTIIAYIKEDIQAGETFTGSYEHTFVKVIGGDGENEIRLMLSEKKDEFSSSSVKKVSTPVLIKYE